ncbi:NodT family efflux transporter outer membrane factor (OMF) lipoprotein [Sphingobium wenxiniae]|uniref:efflux transporter outer membrane subunit n=1 Tax=Sphingobium wenxiniae (strain DSM 21828 / CGMCC 1.7748 / JZ-1) TaxID=595605 RepID=UPI000876050A|nr:efflux transporter outer membrane subunit [Sphingobium wenxiniae]MBB6193556.1 NodT family efflux transporter outer membrane factor (OMF) lipoprotein [Sphingobium wenxiniae]SCW94110.1 efflux transporter, outer membrane factor (OMF) lipoprotein, NodT family [Sphingobium faniae]
MKRAIAKQAVAATAMLLIGGCASVGPDFKPPELPAKVAEQPPAFVEGGTSAFSTAPLPARWWQLYTDPALDTLVGEALTANTDLRAAVANLERSRAIAQEARAAAGIQTSLDGGVSVGEASSLGKGQPAGTSTTFDAGIGISYQVDVVGRIRRTIEAVDADADAQQAAYDLARTTIVANVVDAYSDACATGARIAVAERSIRLQRDSLALTERGRRAGLYPQIDVARSRALLAQLEAAVPPLESSRRAALYSLATLLGRAPRDYPADLADCARIPTVAQAIPVGDGAALIRRRPDIRQAERQLAAATARIGVATAELYPGVSLGASFGTTSTALGNIADDSAFRFSLGPLISWQFPNRAVARTRIAQADAVTRGALAIFDGTVLEALREVETTLAAYSADLAENARLKLARDENRKVAAYQERLSRGGLATGLERLDAQRNLAVAEAALAQSDARIAEDRVRLFLALGGGWEADLDTR